MFLTSLKSFSLYWESLRPGNSIFISGKRSSSNFMYAACLLFSGCLSGATSAPPDELEPYLIISGVETSSIIPAAPSSICMSYSSPPSSARASPAPPVGYSLIPIFANYFSNAFLCASAASYFCAFFPYGNFFSLLETNACSSCSSNYCFSIFAFNCASFFSSSSFWRSAFFCIFLSPSSCQYSSSSLFRAASLS